MSYTEIRLSAQDNDFIADPKGGIIGLQFTYKGDMLRVFCVNFREFDFANRRAENIFIEQILRGDGVTWTYSSQFTRTVSDTSDYRSTAQATFGQVVINPFEEDGITLLPNVCTDAQFFIDTLVKNIYGVTIDMASFIVAEIIDQYELTA